MMKSKQKLINELLLEMSTEPIDAPFTEPKNRTKEEKEALAWFMGEVWKMNPPYHTVEKTETGFAHTWSWIGSLDSNKIQ